MIKTVSSFVQTLHVAAVINDRLPKITLSKTTQVALAGLLFCTVSYLIYRSLSNRITQHPDPKPPSKPGPGGDPSRQLPRTTSSDSGAGVGLPPEDVFTTPDNSDHEDEGPPPLAKSPLELFKEKFPGRHIKHTTRSGELNFADFFLNTIFRIHEQPACTFNTQGQFSLTFIREKVIHISQLPSPDEGEVAWIRKAIEGIIYAMGSPQIQISKVIKGNIEQTDLGTTITFDPTSIFLMPQAGYTAHLKSVTVLNVPSSEGHQLRALGEHNSWVLKNHKGGLIHFRKLVEFVELNPFHSPSRAATS